MLQINKIVYINCLRSQVYNLKFQSVETKFYIFVT